MPSAKEMHHWYLYNSYKLAVAIFLVITILVLLFAVGPGAHA